MASGNAISIQNVTKTYDLGNETLRALESTSLDIENTAFVSVVGASGCGKTTLLKIVGGLLPASTGTISINREPVTGPREDVGFVFQSPVLLPWKTVTENILLPVSVHGQPNQEALSRATELVQMVGLAGFENRYPFELSGGMQQRVAICRALIQDPTCLLLDEPFGALDALTRENMNMLFNELWHKTRKTVVMVTHSIQEAVFMSTRVIVMSQRPGRIVDDLSIPFSPARSAALLSTPEFGRITDRVRQHFSRSRAE